ncbi:MAG: Uma2 family endonuclease [Saprospiraceae bacterium]|nr:Uma2 family endonuclease [Saprospiraceae bacterium]
MTASVSLEETKIAYIPKNLIYEELNGRPLYRQGYKDVLNKTKTIEEIMGCSSLQGIIISVLLRYLYVNTDENQYEVVTNEVGLHVSLGNNLSSDIILYDAKVTQQYQFDTHYFNAAPKMVIEVDVKIDLEDIHSMDYINEKNDTLFKFGVEKVVWVFTKSQEALLAEPNKDSVIRHWSEDFELLEGHSINLKELIEKKGYNI